MITLTSIHPPHFTIIITTATTSRYIGVQRNGQEKHNGRDRGQSQKVKIKNGGEGIPEETLSGHKNIVYEASLSHSVSHCICLPQVLWIYWPDFCCGSFGHHPKQDSTQGVG